MGVSVSTMAMPDSVKEKIEALRKVFAAQVDDRLSELESHESAVRVDAPTPLFRDAVEASCELAHKLIGTAGTFGFAELSERARRLEHLCLSALETDERPPDSWYQEYIVALHSMRAGASTAAQMDQDDAPSTVETMEDAARNRVVLVEDDPEQGGVTKLRLENFGFEVDWISEFSKLRSALKAGPAAAVVMDIMSEADRDAGLVEVRALRKSGVIKCPVIFLTVRDDFKARLGAVRGGADSYLVKPVNIIELVSAIDRLSSRGKVAPFKAVVVDDHEDMANYFDALLTNAGLLVETVTVPDKALPVILDTMPDVILLDIHMPKCNGIELAKVIRQTNSQLFRRPIVFITGDVGDEKRVMTVRSGGDDLISKPVDPDYLVASVLARAERSREISAINARLMSSEEMFRAVAQTAGDGILSCNHDGVVVFTNKAADAMFGLEAESFLGHRITELFKDSSDFDGVRAVAAEALEDAVHTMELDMRRIDGNGFPAEITATHWDVHDGRYLTLIVRDITERKIAAEALEQNARILETTLNTIDQGFVMWAEDKTLVSWNKMSEDIWYRPPNLRRGMPMRELLLHIAQNGGLGEGEPEALAEAEFSRLVGEGTEADDEFRLQDGRAIFVRRFPLPDGGHVATYMDVTHIRHLEDDLHNARGGD